MYLPPKRIITIFQLTEQSISIRVSEAEIDQILLQSCDTEEAI